MNNIENKKISVSVIVPIYNASPYLEKCLDSVVNQTLKNIEIILINDGSTDNSEEICKAYADKDNRIIYYKKENEGLAAARQDGIERAHGEYVGFVDSDDWLELNMYERMFSVAEKHNADIVFCNCYADESEKNIVYLEPGIYDRDQIEKNILSRSLAGISKKGSNSVIRWSNCLRIYKLSLIKDNNIAFGRGFRRSQDLQLTFETTLYAQKYVSICDEYLYHNRSANNEKSLSRGYTKNYWKLIRPLIDKLYEDIDSYKKQDLHNQMHLCTFFFAVAAIRNEYEISNYNFFIKIKKLNEIVKDDVVQNAIKYVEFSKLNNYYKTIYMGIKGKSALSVYFHFSKAYVRNNIYKPLARKIINAKVTGIFFKDRK